MDVKHDLISKLKLMASELGRTPSRDEYAASNSQNEYRKAYRSYTAFLEAAGLGATQDSKNSKKPHKFKFRKSQIESFMIHEIDFQEIFKKAEVQPTQTLRVVAMPDTHVKHRDKKSIKAFLEFIEWYQPHVFIIMGDFIDAEDISHWEPQGLEPRQFIPEIKEARELLGEICKRLRSCILKIFITGNHEDWIDQAMAAKMPEFFNGLDELNLMPDLKSLLDLDNFGFDLIPINHFLKIGKAHYTHGLYVGPNHQKKHLDTVKGNIYYGHTHDMMNLHQPTINGSIEAASLGCLCKLDGKFMKGKPNNWTHGFGIFEFFSDGSYTNILIKMFNGRFSYMGIQFGENDFK